MPHTITKSDSLAIIRPNPSGGAGSSITVIQCTDCRHRLAKPDTCGAPDGPRWPLQEGDGCSRGEPRP